LIVQYGGDESVAACKRYLVIDVARGRLRQEFPNCQRLAVALQGSRRSTTSDHFRIVASLDRKRLGQTVGVERCGIGINILVDCFAQCILRIELESPRSTTGQIAS
jgi:hypothetical protein